jgi:hypothetical protein
MTDVENRIRLVIQKLTEAIWNLDQLEPLDSELKAQYELIRAARENLMKRVKREV